VATITERATAWNFGAFPPWRIFMSKKDKELEIKIVEQDKMFFKLMEERASGKKSNDLLQSMLQARQAEKVQFTDSEILANLWTFSVAGIDTTSSALTSLIWYITGDTVVYNKLTSEIRSIVKDNCEITADQILSMKYLNNVWQEVLRLSGPAPFNLLTAVQDIHLSNGLTIPKDTNIILNNRVSCLSEKYFKDPLKFDPDRWDNPDLLELSKVNTYSFGGGVRVCPGRFLSEIESLIFVSKILSSFDVKRIDNHPPISYKFIISLHFDSDVTVVISPLKK